MPSIYRKSDGQFEFYAGSIAIDLTSYIPATADKQVVVCLWLDTNDNTITVTGSSEVDATTDLKSNPTTAMTYINECADAAPSGAIGISSYLIFDDTTAIDVTNKFHDLRGIIGTGGGNSIAGFPNPVTATVYINTGYQVAVHGKLYIESTGKVVIGGKLVMRD